MDSNSQASDSSSKIDGIQEFYSRYKSQNLNQKRLSVGKMQTQNIAQKYLSDNKRFEEYKSNSYMNSPSNEQINPNYNKANSANNFNLHKSSYLEEKDQGNTSKEQGNNSRDLIGQQDMAYLFNKMETIMIQQNKIFENFVIFESEIKSEISEIKHKITRIESTVYSSNNKDARFNDFANFKSLKNEEKTNFQDKTYGKFSKYKRIL